MWPPTYLKTQQPYLYLSKLLDESRLPEESKLPKQLQTPDDQNNACCLKGST